MAPEISRTISAIYGPRNCRIKAIYGAINCTILAISGNLEIANILFTFHSKHLVGHHETPPAQHNKKKHEVCTQLEDHILFIIRKKNNKSIYYSVQLGFELKVNVYWVKKQT